MASLEFLCGKSFSGPVWSGVGEQGPGLEAADLLFLLRQSVYRGQLGRSWWRWWWGWWQVPQPLPGEMVARGLLELLLHSGAALCTESHGFVVTTRKLSPTWPQEVGEVSTAF